MGASAHTYILHRKFVSDWKSVIFSISLDHNYHVISVHLLSLVSFQIHFAIRYPTVSSKIVSF